MARLRFESHRVTIETPYAEPFVLALKTRIPRGCRSYDPRLRTWTVFRPYVDEARRLAHLYFDIEELDAETYDDYEAAEQAREQAEREAERQRAASDWANRLGFQNPDTCDPEEHPYDVLYLREDAPRHVVEASYKAISIACHPDRAKYHGLSPDRAETLQKRANVAVATIKRRKGWILK